MFRNRYVSKVISFLLLTFTSYSHSEQFESTDNWQPDLSDSIAYFDPIARDIGDEVLSAYPEYALRVLYETQLYIAFQRHLNGLSDDARAKAESEHLQWLNRVYAEYKEEGDYFKNGKLGMLTAEKVLIERIQEKLKDLY